LACCSDVAIESGAKPESASSARNCGGFCQASDPGWNRFGQGKERTFTMYRLIYKSRVTRELDWAVVEDILHH